MPDPDSLTVPRLTADQAAIIGAFTGVLCGPFSDLHGYAERVLDRPIFTHEFGSQTVADTLSAASKRDFLALCYEPGTDLDPTDEEPQDAPSR